METYWGWLILTTHIAILLILDLFVLNKKKGINSSKKAIGETVFFVANALLFAGVIYWLYSHGLVKNMNNLSASEGVVKYITGYLIELSLSIDNLFVIAIIFTGYKIPLQHQHRLLFLGILGAIVFRSVLIGVGLALVHKIEGITIVFGLFLLYTAFKMLKKEEAPKEVNQKKGIAKYFNISNQIDGSKFRTTLNGKKVFTALFGALITIEITDLLFAFDSIPAVFAVTTDPFLVFSSNIFAIMGLRSLYFFLAKMLEKFSYIKYSIFAILVFVSLKLICSQWLKIPEWFSLLFIGISLAFGIIISVNRIKEENETLKQ